MNSKTLIIRSLSGLVYVAAIVLAVLFGEGTVTILALILSFFALYELEKMSAIKIDGFNDKMANGIDIAATFSLIAMPVLGVYSVILWVIFVMSRFIWQLYSPSPTPFKSIAFSVFSQVYIGIPMLCFIILSMLSALQPLQLIALLSLIWINDTGAFLVGCTIGKHRLFPKHSPKKSWEGFIGGMAFNMIAGFIFGFLCFDSFFEIHGPNILLWILAGIIVTVFATWGDLFESMLKRSVGVKDSGKIIPGHGGILDRIDSLLAVMPTILIYIYITSFFTSPF